MNNRNNVFKFVDLNSLNNNSVFISQKVTTRYFKLCNANTSETANSYYMNKRDLKDTFGTFSFTLTAAGRLMFSIVLWLKEILTF